MSRFDTNLVPESPSVILQAGVNAVDGNRAGKGARSRGGGGGGRGRGRGVVVVLVAHSLSSQLPVPLARVPPEAGAETRHGQDGPQEQGEGVARVGSLRRRDPGQKDEPGHRRGAREFGSGGHVEIILRACVKVR